MGHLFRVVHYVNQFFAGFGGEDRADVSPVAREGITGAAAGLQNALGRSALVVATIYCGDNYMADRGERAADEVADLIKAFEPDVVVAGPAFNAGRYGLACGQVCEAVQRRYGIPALTGLYKENPGAEMFHASVIIVPTAKTAAGMPGALKELARLALKLGGGKRLAPPEVDGYLPQGYRQNEFSEERGATRAVTMLLRKIKGEPFRTEWPIPALDEVKPADPVAKKAGISVAMVTTSGLVPKGNPDRLPASWATTWLKYDLSQVNDLTSSFFETIHGGYDTTAANKDPNCLVPIDAFRRLENEGRVRFHKNLYTTTGNSGSLTDMRRLGAEIAKDLNGAEIDAVIVGAT